MTLALEKLEYLYQHQHYIENEYFRDKLNILINLGEVFYYQGTHKQQAFVKAESYYDQALIVSEHIIDKSPIIDVMFQLYINRASLFTINENPTKAEFEFVRAISWLEKYDEAIDHSNHIIANLYMNYGVCLNDLYQFDKAVIFYEKSMELYTQIENSSESIIEEKIRLYDYYGCVLDNLKKYSLSLGAFEKSFDLVEQYHVEKESELFAQLCVHVASPYMDLRQFNKAMMYAVKTVHPNMV